MGAAPGAAPDERSIDEDADRIPTVLDEFLTQP
jgi:hypothetical protein